MARGGGARAQLETEVKGVAQKSTEPDAAGKNPVNQKMYPRVALVFPEHYADAAGVLSRAFVNDPADG